MSGVARIVPAESDVILVIGAVGHVRVDVQIGFPLIEYPDDRPHFGCIQLCIVAIEIEIARVCPPPGVVRSALIDAAEPGRALVSVDIQDRNEEEVGAIEKVAPSPDCDLAQQHQSGVLAVNFSGVNPRLHEERGPRTAVKRFGSEEAIVRRDDHPDVAAFR